MKKLDKGIKQSSKELFVMHHESKYDGLFPFWVSIEVLSFGELSRLFRNLLRTSQIKIIQDFKDFPFTVVSWLHFLSYVRNVSAHYGRLYGEKFVIKPSLKDYEGYRMKNGTVFAASFVLTKLLHHNDRQSFVIGLEAWVEEYSEYIELKEVGFPNQWKEILYC